MELLDPEGDAEDTFEETVREIIRFYARALDEVVGKESGAKLLYSIAESETLFDVKHPLPIDIDTQGRFPIEFHRSTFRLILPADQKTYFGELLGIASCSSDVEGNHRPTLRVCVYRDRPLCL